MPETLYNKYFAQPEFADDTPEYKVIARLVREDELTKRLDFYSLWYERVEVGDTSYVKQKIVDEFTEVFQQQNWKLKETFFQSHVQYLIFQREDLKLTVMFETLGDVKYYPFWHHISGFNIQYSEGHIPHLRRYVHFIYSKNIKP